MYLLRNESRPLKDWSRRQKSPFHMRCTHGPNLLWARSQTSLRHTRIEPGDMRAGSPLSGSWFQEYSLCRVGSSSAQVRRIDTARLSSCEERSRPEASLESLMHCKVCWRIDKRDRKSIQALGSLFARPWHPKKAGQLAGRWLGQMTPEHPS
jgi:hypothetical protein